MKATLTYGIIMNEDLVGPVLKKIRTVEDGAFAIRMRRNLRPIMDAMGDFEAHKKEIIEKYGNGGQGIPATIEDENGNTAPNPAYEKATEELNSVIRSEVEVTWEPFLTEGDIKASGVNLTIEDLDVLELLRIYIDVSPEE